MSLPEEALKGVLEVGATPALQDPVSEVREALRKPIGSAPLRELVRPGESVAVIVNDITRLTGSNIFLPPLLGELNAAGIRDSNILITFASGTHRPMSREEEQFILGPEVARRLKSFQHDCYDDALTLYFGKTSRGTPVRVNRRVAEADRIILTGGILYHWVAGYGGGAKSLIPGVAHIDTISANHQHLFEPGAGYARLGGNPVHEDIVEASRLVGPDFLLNVVLDERGNFVRIVAGDVIEAHREGCREVDAIYGQPIEAPSDLVISAYGGYPKDIELRQVHKGFESTCRAVRKGGVVVLFAECPEGAGETELYQYMVSCKSPEEMAEAAKKEFNVGAFKAFKLARLSQWAELILISAMEEGLVRKMRMTPASSPEEALAIARERLGDNPSIYVIPDSSLVLPIPTFTREEAAWGVLKEAQTP